MKRAEEITDENKVYKKPYHKEDIGELASLLNYIQENGKPVRITN